MFYLVNIEKMEYKIIETLYNEIPDKCEYDNKILRMIMIKKR